MDFSLRQIWFFAFGCILALAPVLGANLLVSRQANLVADQHLERQAALAVENTQVRFGELIAQLRNLQSASGVGCSARDVQRMQAVTLSTPAVSLAATLSIDHQILCASPELEQKEIQLFREPASVFEPDVALTQVQLGGTRITGIMLELDGPQSKQVFFIPRQMLPHFFDRVDERTGLVLMLGDTVIYARDPATAQAAQRARIDVTSLPLADGAMRVQVSTDRNIISAAYEPIKHWVTVGAILIGALVVLLVTRLIHYTPERVNEIERAINAGEFVPYYQPVIDVVTGKLVGCEVLVRWIKPDGTMISPGSFIALAEQTGLAVQMTRKLMETVESDLSAVYADKPGLKVAINLFNQHFTNLDIIEDVEAIFGPSAITYSQVVLEITERAPLESMSQAKIIMRKLQGLGCRLALDDAGTGHGGLAYLQELGLDIVKIDKMFIDQLGKSRIGESITHTLTELASQLNMDVVAEGVERIEQVTHLKRYGIRQAQGYLFAPALPAAQYLELVKRLGVAEPHRKRSSAQQDAERKAATIRAAARQIGAEAKTGRDGQDKTNAAA